MRGGIYSLASFVNDKEIYTGLSVLRSQMTADRQRPLADCVTDLQSCISAFATQPRIDSCGLDLESRVAAVSGK